MGRLIHKEVGGINILGFSLAGEETVVAAPEYNVCFDVGRAPREVISIDNVCITHGHMDHAAGMAYYLSQRAFVGNAPGRIVIHRDLAAAVQRLMAAWADIEGHASPGQILGVVPMEDVPIRRGLVVRPFAVNHGASALGFALIEQRHKLKPEYAGKTGPQLVALKREGVQIEHHIEVSLLACTGDTALGKWLDLSVVRECQVLVMECTFFDREHVSRARDGRHIHVMDVPQVIEAVPQAQILLTHITRRTDLRQAKRTLERALKHEDMQRVTFLMERPPRPNRRPNPVTTPTTSIAGNVNSDR